MFCAPLASSAVDRGEVAGRAARSAAGRRRASCRARRGPRRRPGAAAAGRRGCRRRARRGSGRAGRSARSGRAGSSSPPRSAAVPVPGSSSIVMSWRPVRGRSSRVASGGSAARTCASISIVTTAWPSLELDAGDVADLDAGDVHRLALARRDRLRGRELGLELEAVVAEEGDPGRVAAAAAGRSRSRSPRARPGRAGRSIGDEVAQVFSDRASHGTGTRSGGSGGRGGPVEVGDRFFAQATSMRNGGAACRQHRLGAVRGLDRVA